MIVIEVIRSTPEDAQQKANEAATKACRAIEQFGVTAEILQQADQARPYFHFQNSILRQIERLFQHAFPHKRVGSQPHQKEFAKKRERAKV